MKLWLYGLMLVAVGVMPALPVHAQSSFKGEVKVQTGYETNSQDSLDAFYGEADRWDNDLRLRLMGSHSFASNWSLSAAYLLQTRYGGAVKLNREERGTYYISPDSTALWHLDHTFRDSGNTYVAQRLDRLILGYTGAHLVVKLGRQALTWGGGLVFHPMDLFNPFAPNATDTEYKPGTDLLYGQWLFNNGSDIQGVVAPRRNPYTGSVATDWSSAGMKWHGFFGTTQQFGADLLLARDYGATVGGVGLSGPLRGGTWTAEVVPTDLAGGHVRTSLLANFQYAWALAGKSINGYVEYFRNGFGVGGSGRTLTDLPEPLVVRIKRQQLFTVSRDYLATGINLQWSALLTIKPLIINNLNDGSAFLICQALYSLTQNTNLTVGGQTAMGERGTEYGGLEITPGSKIYDKPASLVYARLTVYF